MSLSRYTWVRLFSRSRWCVFQLATLLIHICIDECYCRSFWWTKSNEEVNCKAIKNDTLLFRYTINEGLEILFSFTFVHLLCLSENFRALILSFFFAFYRSFIRHFVTLYPILGCGEYDLLSITYLYKREVKKKGKDKSSVLV
jgi:hypothetical protein